MCQTWILFINQTFIMTMYVFKLKSNGSIFFNFVSFIISPRCLKEDLVVSKNQKISTSAFNHHEL